jgi:hypothetical protein
MEGSEKFTVVQGNPRGEHIAPEETLQALRDILSWEQAHIPGFISPQNACIIPPELSSLSPLLSLCNGGMQLQETFKTVSIPEILEFIDICSVSIYWKASYVPFASNAEGEFLMLDENTGDVVQWNLDIGVVDQLSRSLASFIENLRNNLLSRKLEYLGSDCGLIEAV